MPTQKLVRVAALLVILFAILAPATALAMGDGDPAQAGSPVVYFQDSDGEDAAAQEGSSDGVGFTLGFLAAVIAVIIFVVAIVSAVGLGVIGIGYAQVAGGEE